MFLLRYISVSLAILLVCVVQEKPVKGHEVNLPPGNLKHEHIFVLSIKKTSL